jgi:hypothetical protein
LYLSIPEAKQRAEPEARGKLAGGASHRLGTTQNHSSPGRGDGRLIRCGPPHRNSVAPPGPNALVRGRQSGGLRNHLISLLPPGAPGVSIVRCRSDQNVVTPEAVEATATHHRRDAHVPAPVFQQAPKWFPACAPHAKRPPSDRALRASRIAPASTSPWIHKNPTSPMASQK